MDILDNLDVLTMVEGATFFITLFLHLSSLPLTYSMVTQRRTDGMPFYTFLFSFANANLACLYGSIVNNRIILTLNSIAVVLYFLACLAFIMNSGQGIRVFLKFFIVSVVVIALYYHTQSLPDDKKQDFIGPISVVTTMIMLSAPLMDVGQFIRKKSCEGMAVTMITLGFLCCAGWTMYGNLLNDPYIYVPNLPGFLSSFVYFTLMAVYGFPKEKAKTS